MPNTFSFWEKENEFEKWNQTHGKTLKLRFLLTSLIFRKRSMKVKEHMIGPFPMKQAECIKGLIA